MTRPHQIAFVLSTAVAIGACGASLAAADWSGARAGEQSVTTGAFSTPADVAVSAAAGSGVITITWKASTFSGDRPVGYVVQRHSGSATSPSAGAPTACVVSAAAVAVGTSRTCNDTGGTPGTSYKYSVRPLISSWSGTTQGLSEAVLFPSTQASPPTVTVSLVGNAFNNASQWTNNGCSGGVCGTISPGTGTLTSFTVQHKRVFEGATRYWDGAAWVTGATNVNSSNLTLSGSAWNYALSYTQLEADTTAAGNPDAQHTLTATATNSAGKTTSVSRAFTSKG